MEKFDLPSLVSIYGSLHQIQTVCAHVRLTGNNTFANTKWFEETCERAAKYCHSVGFEHSSQKAFILLQRFRHASDVGGTTMDAPAVQAEFRSLEDSILIDMTRHQFVQITPSLLGHFGNKAAFGEVVAEAFPDAMRDAEDAGNCIAVGSDTAAVFHLMRVVEFGLRALCGDLKVKQVKKGPVEYATWDSILNSLPDVVAKKINAMQRGPKKQIAQEFYYPALKEINGFKDAWRNHIMHSRSAYNSADALAVFSHVDRFMRSLGEYGLRDRRTKKAV
jgi:hypothetical protein